MQPQAGQQATGMFTRNLIGSLCVSAFKLTDPHSQMGVWFILQDLSVRTEGSFRYVHVLIQISSRHWPSSASYRSFSHKIEYVDHNVSESARPILLHVSLT